MLFYTRCRLETVESPIVTLMDNQYLKIFFNKTIPCVCFADNECFSNNVPILDGRLSTILNIALHWCQNWRKLTDSETLVLPRLLFRGIISHCSNSTRWKIIVCWRPLHYSSCTTNIDLMVTLECRQWPQNIVIVTHKNMAAGVSVQCPVCPHYVWCLTLATWTVWRLAQFWCCSTAVCSTTAACRLASPLITQRHNYRAVTRRHAPCPGSDLQLTFVTFQGKFGWAASRMAGRSAGRAEGGRGPSPRPPAPPPLPSLTPPPPPPRPRGRARWTRNPPGVRGWSRLLTEPSAQFISSH